MLVPLGPRRRTAVVLETAPPDPHQGQLRDVLAILDDAPPLDPTLLELLRWTGSYYMAPLAEVIAAALPAPLRVETERVVVATGELAGALDQNDPLAQMLVAGRPVPLRDIRRRCGGGAPQRVRRLAARGLLAVVEQPKVPRVSTRRRRLFRALDGPVDQLARRRALRELYEYLRARGEEEIPEEELRARFPRFAEKRAALERLGLVACREEEVYRHPFLAGWTEVGCGDSFELTAPQAAAVAAVAETLGKDFRPFVLFGVTGSGKTEVYLRLAELARECGRETLVLVPEISLTHQLVRRFRARLGERVAVLHSQLGPGERWDEWRRIARGEADVVIGARSAVFAPLRRLGLIVVDEEHDPSYKQGESPRYHARDVAVMRARLSRCPIVLGSATPSLESLYNAKRGRYTLVTLGERVAGRSLPRVELVDLRKEAPRPGDPLSLPVLAALRANFAAGGQTLVFLNRRGFANFLQCHACGEILECPRCSVTLTWHRRAGVLRCHYCDHIARPPAACPECGENALQPWGAGTERIEARVRETVPGARVARLDRDTSRRRGHQGRVLAEWAAGEIDILIGTQMVTKGHDVPGVTLVCVVSGDAALAFPDFRAAERTFQLLEQVAGRAGRGERPGRVLVQTYRPEHHALRAAVRHDYETFAAQELGQRRELGYPPFTRLVLLRCEGPDEGATQSCARRLAGHLRREAAGRWPVLGPAPAPLRKLRDRFRWQILMRGPSAGELRAAAARAVAAAASEARRSEVRLVVDVDAVEMR